MYQDDLLEWRPEPDPEHVRAEAERRARPAEDEEANQVRARIQIALQAGVPWQVAELQAMGGPTKRHLAIARNFGTDLACKGDVLMFGSNKKGEAAALMNGLIFAVAVCAFQPGGVTLFGMHFDASPQPEPSETVE